MFVDLNLYLPANLSPCGMLTLWFVLPPGGVCRGGEGGRLSPNLPGLEGKAVIFSKQKYFHANVSLFQCRRCLLDPE